MLNERSEIILGQLHPDLQYVVRLTAEVCDVPFQLHQGARTVEQQQMYFDDGKSQINPKKYVNEYDLAKVAKHIVVKGHRFYKWARAVDFHIDLDGLTWDHEHLIYVAGTMISFSRYFKARGKLMYELRGGLDWNTNGIIKKDQSFNDLCHLEMVY